MAAFETRIVVDQPFDRALGAVVHAVRDEGLDVIASLDVREHFRRTVGHEFRQYALLEVWSPDLAREGPAADRRSGARPNQQSPRAASARTAPAGSPARGLMLDGQRDAREEA